MALFRYKIAGSSHTQGPAILDYVTRKTKISLATHFPQDNTHPHHFSCCMPAYLPSHNSIGYRVLCIMYVRYDLLFNICAEKEIKG